MHYSQLNQSGVEWRGRPCLKSSILLYGRSPLLTAGGSNCTASKYVLTHTQAGWPPLRLPELLSVESSPILPCMHYLVFFFELWNSAQFFSPHSVSLSALYSKFVPFSLATMTEESLLHYIANNHVNSYTNAHSEIVCGLAYCEVLSSGKTFFHR